MVVAKREDDAKAIEKRLTGRDLGALTRSRLELLARSGVGRDINRHHYTRDEVQAELARPVVERLLQLIRFRNTHPAFGGEFQLEESASDAKTANPMALPIVSCGASAVESGRPISQ